MILVSSIIVSIFFGFILGIMYKSFFSFQAPSFLRAPRVMTDEEAKEHDAEKIRGDWEKIIGKW